MKRETHHSIDMTLIGVGIAVNFGSVAVYGVGGMQFQFMLIVLGVLSIVAGVWGVASRAIPNERKYSRLREEGDRMISLIRRLNSTALARDEGLEDETRFQATVAEMHNSVRYMAELASLKDGQNLEKIRASHPNSSPKEPGRHQTAIRVVR